MHHAIQKVRWRPYLVSAILLCVTLIPCLAAEDLPDGFEEPERDMGNGAAADDALERESSSGGWLARVRWVPHDAPSRTLDGLWRQDGSFRRGSVILVAWPTDTGGFRGRGVRTVKRFDDAPEGSKSIKMPTAYGVWELSSDTHLLFPGSVPFRTTDMGVRPSTKEVIVQEEKQQEFLAVKTYPVELELRAQDGALTPFPADALLYGKERILPKIRGSCLTAKVYLPRSHDPKTPYRFRVQGGLISFHVGPKGIEVIDSRGVLAERFGNLLVARYPARKVAARGHLAALSRPFQATLTGGKDGGLKVALEFTSRLWPAGRAIEVAAGEGWDYEFLLTDPAGRNPVAVTHAEADAGVLSLRREPAPYTLGRLHITARRKRPTGKDSVVQGSAPFFLTSRHGGALSLFKLNMGRAAYLAGEEIELRVLGSGLKADGEVTLLCVSSAGSRMAKSFPANAGMLNERPLTVALDTSYISAGTHVLTARFGEIVSNAIDVTLVEDVHESDYLTLGYYKYPSVYGLTSSGLVTEMAGRGVNLLIANYDGRGPSFSRPRSLTADWEKLDPLHEVPRHVEDAYLGANPTTALMDVCSRKGMNYINYGHMVNWCIFGHREDDAEYRRQAIIRAYQLRQFPAFVGMHYADNDMPCVPGQSHTGGPAWNSDGRAGWRMREFNRRFNETYGQVDMDLGAIVPAEELSKVDIDQALNLAASARFSENPKARESLEKTIQSLDRRRMYFRAYHLIWGDMIGGAFRNDMKAMSPQLLVSNAANHQYPDYYFSSFDCAVNSLMTDFGIIPLHNWTEVDLLQMGRMRRKAVFDAVRPCVIHFDRLLLQSLARQPDALGYDFSRVGTMGWEFHPDWRRRCLYSFSLLKRYGAAFLECRTANEVAILNSETMTAVSGGMHPTVYYRAHYALTRAGLPVQFVTEDDIATGKLAGQAALLLVNQQMPLPSKVVKRIDEFAAAGGRIYYDADTVIRLPKAAKQIDVRFTNYRGFGFDGGTEFRVMDEQSIPRGKKVAEAIAKDITFDVSDSNPHVLTRVLHGPDVKYLIAIAEATRNGHVTQHGWPGHRERLKLREKPALIIDLIDWDRISVADDRTFVADFGPYTARPYALLPEPIERVNLSVEKRVALGRENRLRVVPQFVSGEPVQSPIPLEVILRRPDGEVRHCVLRTVSAERPWVNFPLGEDDPAGNWRADVTELLSGRRATGMFDVTQRAPRERFRLLKDVVIHDQQQVADLLRESKGIEVALDYRQLRFRDAAEEFAQRLRRAGCDVTVRVVRQSECREYPSRWWYEKDELEQIRPVEEGQAIGVRTKGAGLKGSFKIEDDNFRELHLTSITRLKYKRNLILFSTDGNWLYGQLAAMLSHQPTRNYPGAGQAMVQMIWAPFDADYNAVVVDAKDRDGVVQALEALASIAKGRPSPNASIARPTPHFAHPRLAALMGKGGAAGMAETEFEPLTGVRSEQAQDNGVIKPSIFQIYHTAVHGGNRFCLAASSIGNVGFDENLNLFWKKHGLDILRGPIEHGRLVARAGGHGLVLNSDLSVHARLAERLPFAVSDDGRSFVQRKNNTYAWSAAGELLWKRSLVGEALRDPRKIRAQARQIAADRAGRYVAAAKAWTREEHATHLSPYLLVRDGASGKLLWHAQLTVSGLQFTRDGEHLVVSVSRRARQGATDVRVVRPADGRVVWQEEFGGASSVGPAVHPAGTQVVAVLGNRKLVSVSREAQFAWSQAVPSVVKAVRFSPDGQHVAYATIHNDLTVLDRRGRRTAQINCRGKPSFAWQSGDAVFFASERGHLGIARIDGTILASGTYTEHVKHESEPLSEASATLSPPSLYDQPFLETVQALKPKVVAMGWNGRVAAPAPKQWPSTRLEAPRELKVRRTTTAAKHERRFLVFRGRSGEGSAVTLTLATSVGEDRLFTHQFRLTSRVTEHVVGLPHTKQPVTCVFKPEKPVELLGPVVVSLPFEYPNLARVYQVEETAANPELQQHVTDISLVTEARCINYENLPADGDHFKLLNGRLYDTKHWVGEKFLTVHDYVVRRKTTSTVDFGSPIPVEIHFKRPLVINCVIAHHVPGSHNSPTADMAVEVWDAVQKAWKLVAYREDNRDLSSVLVFEPVTAGKVRYWMLMTGNGRYGVSEVEVFGPTDPGMGSLEQTEGFGKDAGDGGDDDGLLDDL